MNVRNGQQAIVVLQVQPEAGQARSAKRDLSSRISTQGIKLWSICEEELCCQGVLWSGMKVEVGVELFFMVGGQSRASDASVRLLRSGDEVLSVGQFGIEKSERNGIDGNSRGDAVGHDRMKSVK